MIGMHSIGHHADRNRDLAMYELTNASCYLYQQPLLWRIDNIDRHSFIGLAETAAQRNGVIANAPSE